MQARSAGFGVSKEFLRDKEAGAFAVNRNQLPILQILTPDGKRAVATLGQSHAINRFIAEQHAMLGQNAIERAQIDAIYESVRDIKSDFLRMKRDHPEQRLSWMNDILPEHCQSLEASLPPLQSQSSSPFLLQGTTPSLADVAVIALLGTATSTITGALVTALDDLDPTPAYITTCSRLSSSVNALQQILQTWYKRRPDTFS
jgi:glutathione S-transferase